MKKNKRKAAKTAKSARRAPAPASKNKAGITPLGDRVLLKPTPFEEGTKLPSGIIIPDTAAKEKPEQGTVVAVGPGKRDERGVLVPVGVSVGDRVVFSKYGYDEVKMGEEEYYVIREENILAVITA